MVSCIAIIPGTEQVCDQLADDWLHDPAKHPEDCSARSGCYLHEYVSSVWPASELQPARPLTDADIARRFTYHRPEGQKVEDHEDVRQQFFAWAHDLDNVLPPGREASLAFTALEEASFWAHAAIAREGK